MLLWIVILLGTVSNYVGNFSFELNCFRFIYQTQFVITFIHTLMMKCIYELYVICGMYVESHTILVVVNRLSRPVVVLDELSGLYGFKYDSATACGLPLYLYSYKLVSSATALIQLQCWVKKTVTMLNVQNWTFSVFLICAHETSDRHYFLSVVLFISWSSCSLNFQVSVLNLLSSF